MGGFRYIFLIFAVTLATAGCPETSPRKIETSCDLLDDALVFAHTRHLTRTTNAERFTRFAGALNRLYTQSGLPIVPSTPKSPDELAEICKTARMDFRNSRFKSFSEETLVLSILDIYLRSLDHHSRVEAREEDIEVPAMLGLRIDLQHMPPRIIEVIAGSAAHRAGIPENGLILSINQRDTTQLSPKDFAALKDELAPSNESLELVIEKQDGVVRTYNLAIEFFVESAVSSKLIPTDTGVVGYIRLRRFNRFEDKRALAEAVKSYQDASSVVSALILDLRDNPGGSVEGAAEVANHFVLNGGVFARFSDASGQVIHEEEFPYRVSRTWDGPLIVLVNWATRSAAELLAAALQDYGAVVVGESTFGQGTSHTGFDLGKEFGLNGKAQITDAYNHRPSGATTQLDGVEPDIKLNLSKRDPDAELFRESQYKSPNAIARPTYKIEPLRGFDSNIRTRSKKFLDGLRKFHGKLASKPTGKSKKKRKTKAYSNDLGIDTAAKIGEYWCSLENPDRCKAPR